MLTVIVGPYERRSALRARAVAGALQELGASPEEAREKAMSASLFGGEQAFLLRDMDEETLLSLVSELVPSPHRFVFETDTGSSKLIATLKKGGASVLEAKGEEKGRRLNLFVLADALGARDRKKAWMLLISLLRQGAKPEELAGVLHWQVRSMLVASRVATAEEANMKAFVFEKSRRYAKQFADRELADLSRRLVTLYHESHRGGGQLDLLLERFVLSL